MRCRIPTYTGVVLTAQRGAPHLFVARYETHTLLWRVRGAHKELGRSCLLVLDCSGAWRDVGSYVRCAVLPMGFRASEFELTLLEILHLFLFIHVNSFSCTISI